MQKSTALFVILVGTILSITTPLLGDGSEPVAAGAQNSEGKEYEGELNASWVDDSVSPGEVDVLFRSAPDFNNYSGFLWMPAFRGGLGYVDPDGGDGITYGGGYLRPLMAFPEYGDLVIGGLAVSDSSATAGEFQGEYRLPFGLGFGGGFAKQKFLGPDVSFGKLSFKNEKRDLKFLTEFLVTDFDSETYVGGYGALYGDLGLLSGGYDGEHYRLTAAFMAPELAPNIRPALEVIWADHSIGEFEGPQVMFVNGTVGFSGGFLGNPARLGRAMGPTGIQYSNPIGFLDPSWNRRFDVWEIGDLVNVRYEWIDRSGGDPFQRFDLVVFALAFGLPESPLAGIFLGPTYLDDTTEAGAGIVWGYSLAFDPIIASFAINNWFANGSVTATAGLRYTF